MVYKSIASAIKPFRRHQFQEEMDQKSEEFTGTLFTKSESRTEDLVQMMSEIQMEVAMYTDLDGKQHCFEKKLSVETTKQKRTCTTAS